MLSSIPKNCMVCLPPHSQNQWFIDLALRGFSESRDYLRFARDPGGIPLRWPIRQWWRGPAGARILAALGWSL